ncbi:hypothetical protein ACQYZY_28765 [Pseudomonas aeruginosa]|uniref:hypothetical protein n=1 Tax=Pseudomonas aeruginosa TaxID=287 RepID=UPI003D28F556
MTAQNHRLAARRFTEANIGALATDLLIWRQGSDGLPETSVFHELAGLCAAYASEGDQYQEAERLVMLRALECVSQDFMSRGGSKPTADEAAGMTWWNALTEDERRYWMATAGDTGVVADAWAAYKRNSN